MDFFSLQIRDKIVFFLIALFLLFLAYSEALKNISSYLLIGFFLWNMFTGQIKVTQDIINLSLISHLIFVIIGVFLGINLNESLSQVEDVIHIVLLFLFFREANLYFITYEKILNFLFIGFIFAVLLGMYEIVSGNLNRLELHSVGSINRSAVYIMYIFVTALCLYDKFKIEKNSRLIFLFVIALSFAGILLGASRMSIFTLPIVVIIYLVLSRKINFKLLSILAAIGLFIMLLIFYLFPDSLFVFKVSKGIDDMHRIQIWISSIIAWREHNLWFGIGVGNSIFIDVAQYFPNNALTNLIDNAHNVYLDMIMERGILGIATFLGFIVSILLYRSNEPKIFLIFIKVLIFSLLIMGIANITFRYEFALLFVTLIGAFLNPTIRK